MKKTFPYIAGLLICLIIPLEIVLILSINKIRLAKANEYYLASKDAKDEEKALLLMKSNVIAPSQTKKDELINYFLDKGDFNKAEKYLKRDKTETGLEKYAEAALESAEFTKSENVIEKIKNTNKKEEYGIFLRFAKGDYEAAKDLPKEPITNVGKLIQLVNTGNYTIEEIPSVLGKRIAEVVENSRTTTAALKVANIMLEGKQYKISLFILDNLEQKNDDLLDLYILKAKNNYLLSDFQTALGIQKKAINIAPENISLYRDALVYAKGANNPIEINHLIEQIRYLESIQK